MLRRLICRIRSCSAVFEVDHARLVGRFRCTRCGKTSPDLPLSEVK